MRPYRIWVTGGTGFFGDHIVQKLGGRAIVSTRHEVDLLDSSEVEEFVRQGRFDGIVHAAGFVGGMQLMREQPERMYDENLRMGLNVLNAAAKPGNIHMVLIGTALSYPEVVPIPTPESALFSGPLEAGSQAYGSAKLEVLRKAQELGEGGKLAFTHLIPTNMYGPGNHLEPERSNVIASLILRTMEAKEKGERELIVWGEGSETRDFLYVEDAAHAVELAIDQRPNGEVLNLGSEKETSIRELAEAICAEVGFGGELRFDPSKGGGARRRCLDTTRCRLLLGFQASTRLEEGLKKTVTWIGATRLA